MYSRQKNKTQQEAEIEILRHPVHKVKSLEFAYMKMTFKAKISYSSMNFEIKEKHSYKTYNYIRNLFIYL